jgi:replicative DNA helicase
VNDHIGPLVNTILGRPAQEGSSPAGALLGLPTGIAELDALTLGLQPGSLTVLASRPGMGRTALLASICRHNAVTGGVPTLAYTLEEAREAWGMRMLAAQCLVPIRRLQDGTLTDVDRERLASEGPAVASAPLHVHSPASIDMARLAAQAAEMVAESRVRLIAVDGIQDVRPEKRSDLREREVGDVARDLKTLARELNVPVVATSHLNRSPEMRIDKTPRLDDLRESGAITFAADTIVFLHRPDYYEPEGSRTGEADLVVGKHRAGRTAVVTVVAQLHYGGRFVGMAPSD